MKETRPISLQGSHLLVSFVNNGGRTFRAVEPSMLRLVMTINPGSTTQSSLSSLFTAKFNNGQTRNMIFCSLFSSLHYTVFLYTVFILNNELFYVMFVFSESWTINENYVETFF